MDKSDELCNAYLEADRRFLDDAMSRIKAACESPIEEIFALAMLLEFQVNADALKYSAVLSAGIRYRGEDVQLGFNPQVVEGMYRLDFAIQLLIGGKSQIKAAIECDGHEFHEKTREQVEHRNIRDRYLTSKGYTIYHISGSEIFRKPVASVVDVLDSMFNYLASQNQYRYYKAGYYGRIRDRWEQKEREMHGSLAWNY